MSASIDIAARLLVALAINNSLISPRLDAILHGAAGAVALLTSSCEFSHAYTPAFGCTAVRALRSRQLQARTRVAAVPRSQAVI
jgi:hypothetical protein